MLKGKGTKFSDAPVGGSLDLGEFGEFKIKSIRSDEEITVAN